MIVLSRDNPGQATIRQDREVSLMHRYARLWFAGALVLALAVGSMVAA